MTATERLRQLLDERGVEWRAAKAPLPVTSWHGVHGFKFTAMNPYGVTGYLLVQTNTLDEWPHLTPEQAVEATLGRGTCGIIHRHQDATIPDLWQCNQCREWWWQNEKPSYCPNCGRRVES